MFTNGKEIFDFGSRYNVSLHYQRKLHGTILSTDANCISESWDVRSTPNHPFQMGKKCSHYVDNFAKRERRKLAESEMKMAKEQIPTSVAIAQQVCDKQTGIGSFGDFKIKSSKNKGT